MLFPGHGPCAVGDTRRPDTTTVRATGLRGDGRRNEAGKPPQLVRHGFSFTRGLGSPALVSGWLVLVHIVFLWFDIGSDWFLGARNAPENQYEPMSYHKNQSEPKITNLKPRPATPNPP